jgi:hypothetical protein
MKDLRPFFVRVERGEKSTEGVKEKSRRRKTAILQEVRQNRVAEWSVCEGLKEEEEP